MEHGRIIVMITDFGREHWYDAAMKGEVLRRAAGATILDLSHEIPRHSVELAAFQLDCAVDSFPQQTIFLCVVDPGVGTSRRTLVGWVGEMGFVGPDNGLVTPLLDRSNGFVDLYEIKAPSFRNERVSKTFHGRDIFAPAAARLLLGDDPRLAGPRVTDPIRLGSIRATASAGEINGRVMMIDHFGNAITNIDESAFGDHLTPGKFELRTKHLRLSALSENYGGAEKGKPLCYWGSSRRLEIAVNYGSAAADYLLSVGDPVTIKLLP